MDMLRIFACYMVIQVHAGEFYYIGNIGQTLNTADAHWVGWYNSICRSCVPLFVVLSGYYLFPVTDAGVFFKKRMSRVAIPFLVWCVLYAFYQYFMHQATLNQALLDIPLIFVNYGTDIGHLWYVYMLLGIYLFAPVISPWVISASKKAMEFYLILWAVSLTIPYIHLIFPQIWGEAFWNHTPTLYYFSGFMGFAILAAYIKRFHTQPRAWNYTLGALLIILGNAITTYGFLVRLPAEKFVGTLELTWSFETINVAMIAAGIFLLFKNITISNGNTPGVKLLGDISNKTYGIYLAHIMVLNAVYDWINPRFGSAAIKVPLIAVITFSLTFLLLKALSYLPKSGKLLM